MARLAIRTAGKARTKTHTCPICHKPIEQGQRVYTWQLAKSPRIYQHVDCGQPKPSQLSRRKTAAVLDAVQDFEKGLSQWQPELDADALTVPAVGEDCEDTVEVDTSDLIDALGDVVSSANDVADEYEGSADSMPENLQYGYQAEAMRDVAERLRDWATDLEDFDPDCGTEVELPAREEDQDEDEWRQACVEAFEAKVDEIREAASDKTQDVPEYEA